jgi:hypothetical protein
VCQFLPSGLGQDPRTGFCQCAQRADTTESAQNGAPPETFIAIHPESQLAENAVYSTYCPGPFRQQVNSPAQWGALGFGAKPPDLFAQLIEESCFFGPDDTVRFYDGTRGSDQDRHFVMVATLKPAQRRI